MTPPHIPGDASAGLDFADTARTMLEAHWRSVEPAGSSRVPSGFCVPNATTYPWQWLWDSCFHAIAWAELGDERALGEVEQLFAFQTESGFVPHMNYTTDPGAAEPFWGRPGASTITQPPMYGHALRVLAERDMTASGALLEQATRGLRFLFDKRRRTEAGLIELVHPWESGCDDSARWDAAIEAPWTPERWRAHKHHLLTTLQCSDDGAAIANDDFPVGSIGFNALVAFNARELAQLTDDEQLLASADELAETIGSRFDADAVTWIDDSPLATRGVRTLDAFFALLVDPDRAQPWVELIDPAAYGGECGPAGAHRHEPSYDPLTYWRGPAWPQMTYLLWVAARRAGRADEATAIGEALVAGASRSGLAEYWHPDTGQGLGAIPQSWAALGILIQKS